MTDEETAIVMCYTGWTREMAEGAIAQWRASDSSWSAEYIKQYLSARDLENLERLTTETDNETR